MIKKNAYRVAAIGVVGAALVAGSAVSAQAVQSNGSDLQYNLYDSGTELIVAPGHVNLWDDDLVASPDAGGGVANAHAPFTCSADADGVQTFISPVGQERTRSSWLAYADGAFFGTTKNVVEPGANLSAQILGAASQVKSAGGNYSLGLACLKDNSVNFSTSGLWFAPITVTAGSGSWTYALSDAVTPPAPASGSFDQTIQATTIAAADGSLNLVAPASATTVLGAAALVNGLSTSTGDLGKFTVQDARVVSHPGWTLTTAVTDFKKSDDASVVIPSTQLSITPKAAASSTLPAAVTLSAPYAAKASAATSSFAEAGNAAAIATTDLDAGLKFVAPADKPAGTYTAKLTVTLASK